MLEPYELKVIANLLETITNGNWGETDEYNLVEKAHLTKEQAYILNYDTTAYYGVIDDYLYTSLKSSYAVMGRDKLGYYLSQKIKSELGNKPAT